MDSLVVVLIVLASSFEYSSNNKFRDEFIKADSAFNKEIIIKQNENKYEKLFNEADSSFNEKYRFNINEMKKASDEAAKSALYKTINELYNAFVYKRNNK